MSKPFYALFLSALCLWALPVTGATLALDFKSTSGTTGDPLYPGISTVSTASGNLPGIVATLTGRGYGVEQAGPDRWGITAGPLPWDASQSGWTVRNGFAPDRVGAVLSSTAKDSVEASYLTLFLSGVTEGTLFKGVTLTFTDVTFLRPGNAWAGTSADAFAEATALKFQSAAGTLRLSVTLPEFTWNGGAPLEIRVYGVIGSDEGAFKVLSVAADLIPPTAVPEPGVGLLVAVLGWVATLRFRRRDGLLAGAVLG